MTLKKLIAYSIAAYITVAVLTLAGVSKTYALLPLGILVVSLMAGVAMLITRNPLAKAFGWLFVLAIISLLVARHINQSRATEQVAAAVATAIETYRNSHGDYPSSLDALVPGHFSLVPKKSFHYFRTTNGFRLSYGTSVSLRRSYDSSTRAWTIND